MSNFVKIFALVAAFGFLGNAFANDTVAEHKDAAVAAEANAEATKEVVKNDVKKAKHAKKHAKKHIKQDEKKLANDEAIVAKDEKKIS